MNGNDAYGVDRKRGWKEQVYIVDGKTSEKTRVIVCIRLYS